MKIDTVKWVKELIHVLTLFPIAYGSLFLPVIPAWGAYICNFIFIFLCGQCRLRLN